MDLFQMSHFFSISFIQIKICLAARFVVSNLGVMRSILRICCKLIKLWTPNFPILTKKCITRGLKRLPLGSTNASSPLRAFIFPRHYKCYLFGLKRLPLGSTNASSPLRAFIFPRHYKCYLFGILVSSLESHNMSKLSHEEEIAGLNVMTRPLLIV